MNYLLIPNLRVNNVNAITSPITWGFPSPTAFLGFAHALERKTGMKFGGVGVICHRFDAQTYDASYNKRFCLTRNPVDKAGNTSSIVEEGRASMTVSLIIETNSELTDTIDDVIGSLRLAGGSIQQADRAMIVDESVRLDDGFALIGRDDLLSGDATLERLIELTQRQREYTENGWKAKKKSGWYVPIPVGYAGISELYDAGEVLNARDKQYPFRFVECVYSVGEWVSAKSLKIENILWRNEVDEVAGIYRCVCRPFFCDSVAVTENQQLTEVLKIRVTEAEMVEC